MDTTVDSREPPYRKALIHTAIPSTQIQLLAYGDIRITDTHGLVFLMEHKTTADFMSTVTTKDPKGIHQSRLHRQLYDLSNHAHYPSLLLVGQMSPTKNGFVRIGFRDYGMRWSSVQNMLLSFQLNYGVLIQRFFDDTEMIQSLVALEARSKQRDGFDWPTRSRRE